MILHHQRSIFPAQNGKVLPHIFDRYSLIQLILLTQHIIRKKGLISEIHLCYVHNSKQARWKFLLSKAVMPTLHTI